jgi:hypothetical protein
MGPGIELRVKNRLSMTRSENPIRPFVPSKQCAQTLPGAVVAHQLEG